MDHSVALAEPVAPSVHTSTVALGVHRGIAAVELVDRLAAHG